MLVIWEILCRKFWKKIKVFDVSKEILAKAKEKNLETTDDLDSLITKEVTTIVTMFEALYKDNGIINKVSKDCLLIDCSRLISIHQKK